MHTILCTYVGHKNILFSITSYYILQWTEGLLTQISNTINKVFSQCWNKKHIQFLCKYNLQIHALKKKHMKKYTAFVPVYETQEDNILKGLPIVVINW